MNPGIKKAIGWSAAIILIVAAVALNSRQIFRQVSAPRIGLSSTGGSVSSFRLEDAKLAATDIKEIASGKSDTIILTHDGTVLGSGMNDKGQLGIGDREHVVGVLYPVEFPEPARIIDIDTSDAHTLALDDKGIVWSWGMNISGQIGDGTHANRDTPYKVMGNATDIAAGYRMSAAVDKDGHLWTWGLSCDKTNPLYAQLLVEFAANASAGGFYYGGADVAEQQDCLNEQNLPIGSVKPRKIDGVVGVRDISAGFGHMLWSNGSELWSWGCNAWSQLGREGNANNANTVIPARTPLPPGIRPVQVSAGFRHSAIIDQDGAVWTWGHNVTGDTGTGSTAQMVASAEKLPLDAKAVQVTAGFDGTVILLEDGRLIAAGSNMVQRFVRDTRKQLEGRQQLADGISLYSFARETVLFIKENDEVVR
jgi:alpha-tubulin suppressor-like RCC1 family protein